MGHLFFLLLVVSLSPYDTWIEAIAIRGLVTSICNQIVTHEKNIENWWSLKISVFLGRAFWIFFFCFNPIQISHKLMG